LKIAIGIPTGRKKAIDTIAAWRNAGAKLNGNIETLVYSWNGTLDADHLYTGEMKPFPVLQNFLANQTDWDGYICGADDLYPDDISELPAMIDLYQGKVLWVRDGLFNSQPTHPVITRKWFNGTIFDERFRHNFCDTDLFISASQAGQMVKCFNIAFDHRHPLKTKEPLDEIYKIGQQSYEDDKKRLYEKYKDKSMMLGFVPTH